MEEGHRPAPSMEGIWPLRFISEPHYLCTIPQLSRPFQFAFFIDLWPETDLKKENLGRIHQGLELIRLQESFSITKISFSKAHAWNNDPAIGVGLEEYRRSGGSGVGRDHARGLCTASLMDSTHCSGTFIGAF